MMVGFAHVREQVSRSGAENISAECDVYAAPSVLNRHNARTPHEYPHITGKCIVSTQDGP